MSAAPGVVMSEDRSRLRDGEAVIFIDRKERTYLRILRRGRNVSLRGAPVPCDSLIGLDEGSTIETPHGERLLLLRPTYAQLIPALPRRAQPIYPKDLGPILLLADIYPGARVLESGVGSGALSMTMLRAGAAIVGYELREDFAKVRKGPPPLPGASVDVDLD